MARPGTVNPVKDPETHVALYQGVTFSQLAVALDMNEKAVKDKLHELTPCGVGPRGVALYKLGEAAQILLKPRATPDDLREMIKQMHFTELPMILRKEFWAGERLRQDYLIKAGELWSTSEVIEKVGELFKLVKTSAQLMSDSVERSTELSDRQRAIFKQITDSFLSDLQKKVETQFKAVPKEAGPLEFL